MITRLGRRAAISAAALLLVTGFLVVLAISRASVDEPSIQGSPSSAPGGQTAVLVGAGDIGTCRSANDEATADLLDAIPGTVITLGDNAYADGTAAQFADCYDPSWGRHLSRTRPSPGNHDYRTRNAAAYYEYFGGQAAGPGGYYAFDAGEWRVYSLNSNVVSDEELDWLIADLAANPRSCILAYWHHPRFSSGRHGDDADVAPFWDALSGAAADVIVNAHDHDYERFAPQTPTGEASPSGIRQFVVGTGGRGLRPFSDIRPNSEVRNADTYGVLKLTLGPTEYAWEFVPVAGGSFRDSGSGSCS